MPPFVEFLVDPDRAGVFYIGGASRTELSCRILEMFASHDAASKSEESIAGHLACLAVPVFQYFVSSQPSAELISVWEPSTRIGFGAFCELGRERRF
ncbi:hypothetical protein R3P38DRAFT_3202335 [Favolaschia claudopus]|uniref:Uncharacterized protein n=1 Tax=Favolaschia claudopus TaxID=2862362 RepID=A0AAW0ATN6_9AGAR